MNRARSGTPISLGFELRAAYLSAITIPSS
jgi:hypothetical protein